MKECPACNLCFDDEVNVCPNDNEMLVFSNKCSTNLGDRYILEHRLGKGGMGSVFKAKHRFLKSSHAIKIISPEVVKADPTLLIRFTQEAILAASIHHPNVISVTDFGVENEDTLYLVMEYIEGISLDDYLRTQGRITPARALEFLAPIILGVAAAHSKGITHRDLKPLNVMLKNGYPPAQAVKVLDFGLAKIKSTESFSSFVQAKTTALLGSPHYMPPEQWANENVDTRSDIYSIGVILFQMLTGVVPFKGDSVPTIMYQHLQAPTPTFASLGVTASLEIERVVQKALAKNQDDRFETVEEFLKAYEDALAGTSQQIPINITGDQTVAFQSDNLPNFKAQSSPGIPINRPTGDFANSNQGAIQSQPSAESLTGKSAAEVSRSYTPNSSSAANPVDNLKTIVSPDSSYKSQTAAETHVLSTEISAGQMFVNTSSTQTSNTNPIPARSGFNFTYAIIGLVALFLVAGVGGYLLFRPASNSVIAENGNSNNTNGAVQPKQLPDRVNQKMVQITGGVFQMGRDDVKPDVALFGVQFPAFKTEVKNFYIDKTEVTNQEYLEFVQATGSKTPQNWASGKPPAGQEKFPVTYVSNFEAREFADWISKRDKIRCQLPTEEEWEYAARSGSKQNIYPWGNEWIAGRANISSLSPHEVGTATDETVDGGIKDMLGNVLEWTQSTFKYYQGFPKEFEDPKINSNLFPTVRGASFKATPEQIKNNKYLLTYRQGAPGDAKEPFLGFRLVCQP